MFILFIILASFIYMGTVIVIGGFPVWYKAFFCKKIELVYLPSFLFVIGFIHWVDSSSMNLLIGLSPHIVSSLICGYRVDKQITMEYELSEQS